MTMPPLPPDHREMRDLVELYVVGALTPAERAQFEWHLATCEECQREVRSASAAMDAVSRSVPQLELPPALRTRVITAVTGAAPKRERPNFSVIPWLAMAAALAAAVGLAGYAAIMKGRVGSLETQLRESAQLQSAVLVAPDVQRIDLAGQSVAPQSAGRAFWSRTRGLVFTASNLPALPPGRTYQLWVLTAQPAPISAGVFKPDASGRASAAVQTPVDIPQPTGMAVTIEPDGGVPSPTGEKYLVGP